MSLFYYDNAQGCTAVTFNGTALTGYASLALLVAAGRGWFSDVPNTQLVVALDGGDTPLSGTVAASYNAYAVTESPQLEAADPYLPRFDAIGEVFFFYSNNFDTGDVNYGTPSASPNTPIDVDGNNWITYYTTFNPTSSADFSAGFYLYKDVSLSPTAPLCIAIPVQQNGVFAAQSVSATIYYIDGTSTTLTATAAQDFGDTGYGRLIFTFTPGAATVLAAGEYYVKFAQADYGYSYLSVPPYSAELNGWAIGTQAAITGEAIADGVTTITNAGIQLTYTLGSYTPANPMVGGSQTYHGTIVVSTRWSWRGSNGSGTHLLVATVNLDTQAVSLAVTSGWSGATAYIAGDVVSYSGAYYISIQDGTNHTPTDYDFWRQLQVRDITFDAYGYPIRLGFEWRDYVFPLGIGGFWSTAGDAYIATATLDATTAVTVNYSTAEYLTLAEMMVYSPASGADISATRLYKGQRYTKKNTAMPGGAIVQTARELPVWMLSDGHSFYTLYQTVDLEDAQADAQLVSVGHLNAMDQYCHWRNVSGTLSGAASYYYLPKWIGEVKAFTNFQNRAIFGGVGGLAIFDPKNILEATPYAGKIHTPWRDVVIPDLPGRIDSQYLTDAGITPTDVYPPVVTALFVYGDQPGHLVVCTQDYVTFAGGATVGTASDVWTFQALSQSQIGDGEDEIRWGLYFDGRGLIGTKRGDVYSITGTVPVNWSTGTNTLSIRKERSLRDANGPIVFEHIVDTGLGFMIGVTNQGTLYTMDGSLIPQPFGEEITVHGDEPVNLNVSGFSWDGSRKRMWIHSDGFQARGYYVSTTFTPVDVSARSFVWDSETKGFWPVVNPLDEDARTDKPAVFRDGNVSWSCGYHLAAGTYTFYVECDIAGVDPLPLHNTDEALYQPENSTKHATSSTAYLLTKLMTADDHSAQVRYLQSLARLIDGTDCTLSVVCEGVETSLGTFSGSTDFATLAHKVTSLRVNRTARVNSMQIKLTITNQYADIVHNLLVKSDLSGWPI